MHKVIFENKAITKQQIFDPTEGYLKQELLFNEDGQLDGTCTEWFDDEKVKQVEVYLKGKKQSAVYYDKKKGLKLGELEVRQGKPYQGL